MRTGSEPDIWEAIEDIKGFATVDPNRWYLSGHSWGGDDTWSIAQRTPDLWDHGCLSKMNFCSESP